MAAAKKIKNTGESIKGKAKEATGKLTGDKSLETEGRAEQVKADAEQTVEKAKDTRRH